jgi:hypothetical protein
MPSQELDPMGQYQVGNAVGRTKASKSLELDYDHEFGCMILKILDAQGMYPLVLSDPEAGAYRIIKTSTGKLQMIR